MLHAAKLVTKLAAPKSVNQTFARSYIASRPRVRVSFAEKVTHGLVFTAAILAIPCYISVNLKNYRGPVES